MKKQQQNMLTLYIGFFVSTILNFFPNYNIQIFAFIFFFILLVTAYIYRSKYKDDEFQYSHSKYIIKTIWIFSFFLLLGTMAAGIFADNSSINNIMDQAMNGIIMSESELETILMAYTKQNFFVFLITIGPSFLYFFYRIFNGFSLVRNNRPITNLKNWF